MCSSLCLSSGDLFIFLVRVYPFYSYFCVIRALVFSLSTWFLYIRRAKCSTGARAGVNAHKVRRSQETSVIVFLGCTHDLSLTSANKEEATNSGTTQKSIVLLSSTRECTSNRIIILLSSLLGSRTSSRHFFKLFIKAACPISK